MPYKSYFMKNIADENLVQIMERLSSVLYYHMIKFNEEGSKDLSKPQRNGGQHYMHVKQIKNVWNLQ